MCDCINDINKKLIELNKNTQLDIPIVWSATGSLKADRIAIAVKKLDSKKREKPISIKHLTAHSAERNWNI